MAAFTLKSAQFRKEREQSWRQLERLVNQCESRGIRSLSSQDLHLLPILYRGAVGSLSVARAISLDKNLLEYLQALAGRAYLLVYRNQRPVGAAVAEFFRERFPRSVRGAGRLLVAAAGLFLLGFLCGLALTLLDPERYPSFVPEAMAQGRNPASSTEHLRGVLYEASGREQGLTIFASFLFTHNAKIGILCFCLGFAAGVPVVLLVFYNGLLLGAMTALYHSRGLGGEFLAWVMGHGVTEIGAVCLCAAAGLALGGALLFPGRRRRLDHLARRGQEVAPIVIGSVLMFFLAALLESFFRHQVHSVAARWSMATGSLLFWSWYFGWAGRARRAGPAPGGEG